MGNINIVLNTAVFLNHKKKQAHTDPSALSCCIYITHTPHRHSSGGTPLPPQLLPIYTNANMRTHTDVHSHTHTQTPNFNKPASHERSEVKKKRCGRIPSMPRLYRRIGPYFERPNTPNTHKTQKRCEEKNSENFHIATFPTFNIYMQTGVNYLPFFELNLMEIFFCAKYKVVYELASVFFQFFFSLSISISIAS